mmetsp:Transcript_39255/g.77198  ORF Transcript_39255/g.77198 Transcript_39255/m.77198 type:complete len:371 (-) Transcript_39255:127-1239(-)|eukprot:CAMPEP_0175091662 /NCGR_PEP_ID=MMETSP0086_2-20121207/2027_1 /TAXON_ID=136419 /ORGANISM="Unknown Unknown, Strain D1" /LENGTH=370 /DNA_ID=CAMNT_0016364429 /DNA_START=29 /DNA_END=1141 /DNA_ORIENTATION=-
MTSSTFTPSISLLGGIIIGLSVTLWLITTGRLTGLSGILSGLVPPVAGKLPPAENTRFKLAHASGMVQAGIVLYLVDSSLFSLGSTDHPYYWYAIGGLLVGLGTRIGNGCTSGHGICGMALLRKRSLAGVLTFLTTGIATSTALQANHSFPTRSSPEQPESNAMWAVLAISIAMLGASILLDQSRWRDTLVSWFCGAVFSVGLAVSGMTKRDKVLNFLGITKSWDGSLAFVLGGALVVSFVSFHLIRKFYKNPVLDKMGSCQNQDDCYTFSLPSSESDNLDFKLIIGGWLFGAGWGMTGLCPGPALLVGSAGFPKVLAAFLPAMFLGFSLAIGGLQWWQNRTLQQQEAAAANAAAPFIANEPNAQTFPEA